MPKRFSDTGPPLAQSARGGTGTLGGGERNTVQHCASGKYAAAKGSLGSTHFNFSYLANSYSSLKLVPKGSFLN